VSKRRAQLRHYEDREGVGLRIREAREAAGLSQRELAFPGCTAAYISRIERGDRVPSLQIIREFASRLAVTEEWITGKSRPEGAAATLMRARAALRLGDLVEAGELAEGVRSTPAITRDRAEALSVLGEIELQKSNAVAAVSLLEEARELCPTLEVEIPDFVEALGRSYARANQYEAAIGVLLANYRRVSKAGDVLTAVRFGALLANAYADTANFGAAEDILGALLAEAPRVDDPISRARILWAQSRMHALRKDGDNAARFAERALQVLEVAGYGYYVGLAQQLLAHIELDRGNGERALELLEEASPLIRQGGRPFEEAALLLERARAMLALGRRKQAAAMSMEATATLEHASPLDAGRGYMLVAQVFGELRDTSRAIELLELAVERLETVPTRYLVEAYTKLAELYEKRGDPDRALAILRKAMKIQHDAGVMLV
jgi:tetratricopeptide (TPR) repeat protein